MGFVDKLKAVKNLVTGGGAKVSLEIADSLARGRPVPVTVRCRVEGTALAVTRVYVAVRGIETVNPIAHERETRARDRIYESELTFSQEFVIHGEAALPTDSTHEWRGQIQLPDDVRPTLDGEQARYAWEVLAALDVTGNDPDTGWLDITVR